MRTSLLLFLFSILSVTGFSLDPINNNEKIAGLMNKEGDHSNINISVSVAKQAILDSLNTVIDESLATDFDFGYGDLEIKTWKTEEANFKLQDKDLYLDLGLKIWAKKNIIFADAEATGQLKLIFKTRFDVDKNWKIQSKTSIHNYTWETKPVIEVGIIKLPAETIANVIIERTKEEIASQIDLAMAENLEIDKDIFELYDVITESRPIDEANNLWLKVNPIEINVRKLEEDKDSLRTVINFRTNFNIVNGEKPERPLTVTLPPFNWVDKVDEDSRVKLRGSLSMNEVRKLVRDSLVGRTFKNGKREISVDSIHIIPDGENIKVESYIKGSVNGKATIKGRPKFDKEKQELKIEKLGIRLKTPNIFNKIGFWFAKRKIKKFIRKEIQYSLRDQMELARKSVLDELQSYDDIDGIKVVTKADQVSIEDIYFNDEEITGNLTAKGHIHISILDIRALSNFDLQDIK